eukprot:scaffold44_cov411-Prasinococcus_capsulatus_cf.AAC.27
MAKEKVCEHRNRIIPQEPSERIRTRSQVGASLTVQESVPCLHLQRFLHTKVLRQVPGRFLDSSANLGMQTWSSGPLYQVKCAGAACPKQPTKAGATSHTAIILEPPLHLKMSKEAEQFLPLLLRHT